MVRFYITDLQLNNQFRRHSSEPNKSQLGKQYNTKNRTWLQCGLACWHWPRAIFVWCESIQRALSTTISAKSRSVASISAFSSTRAFSALPSLSRTATTPHSPFPRKLPEYETLTTVAAQGVAGNGVHPGGPIYNAVAQQQGIGDLYQQTGALPVTSSYAVSTIISRQQPTAAGAASYTKI